MVPPIILSRDEKRQTASDAYIGAFDSYALSHVYRLPDTLALISRIRTGDVCTAKREPPKPDLHGATGQVVFERCYHGSQVFAMSPEQALA